MSLWKTSPTSISCGQLPTKSLQAKKMGSYWSKTGSEFVGYAKGSAVEEEKVQTSLNLSTLTLSETKLKPKKVDGKLMKQKRGP